MKDSDASFSVSTNVNSPNAAASNSCFTNFFSNSGSKSNQFTTGSGIPRVVIRHRIKGAKKAQKRLRKNGEQNKILVGEFKKNPVWQKAKIVELQQRLGLKQSQIYKWNWDMQRKLAENPKNGGSSVSAPELSCNLSGLKGGADDEQDDCWTGDIIGEVNMCEGFAQSHEDGLAARSQNEDSKMMSEEEKDDDHLYEVQSQGRPQQNASLCADIAI